MTRRQPRTAARQRPPKAKPGEPYHHGNLRRALIDAALALIQEGGPKGLTLRAAARLAGVSQAAPYRHFADKETLLAAVAEEGFRALAEEMNAALAENPGASPAAAMRALGVAYVRFAVKHPSHFRVMFGPEVPDKEAHPSLAEAGEATYRPLIEAIERCQQAGLMRAGDPMDFAVAAWSIVHGLSALLVDGRIPLDGPKEKHVERLANLVTLTLFEGTRKRDQ